MVAPDMKKQRKCLSPLRWGLALALVFELCGSGQVQPANQLVIQSVSVNNKYLSPLSAGNLNLGTYPKNISFGFGGGKSGARPPLRLRGKLEGFENNWREGAGYMFL